MGSKKISDLGEAKGTRFMDFGRKVSAMAARYRRDISVVIFELGEQSNADDDDLATLQSAGSKTMRECDYIAAYGNNGFIFVLPETPADGAEAFAGRVRQALPVGLPDTYIGIAGWSPSAVAPGILSLVSTAAEALEGAYQGGAEIDGMQVKLA